LYIMQSAVDLYAVAVYQPVKVIENVCADFGVRQGTKFPDYFQIVFRFFWRGVGVPERQINTSPICSKRHASYIPVLPVNAGTLFDKVRVICLYVQAQKIRAFEIIELHSGAP